MTDMTKHMQEAMRRSRRIGLAKNKKIAVHKWAEALKKAIGSSHG